MWQHEAGVRAAVVGGAAADQPEAIRECEPFLRWLISPPTPRTGSPCGRTPAVLLIRSDPTPTTGGVCSKRISKAPRRTSLLVHVADGVNHATCKGFNFPVQCPWLGRYNQHPQPHKALHPRAFPMDEDVYQEDEEMKGAKYSQEPPATTTSSSSADDAAELVLLLRAAGGLEAAAREAETRVVVMMEVEARAGVGRARAGWAAGVRVAVDTVAEAMAGSLGHRRIRSCATSKVPPKILYSDGSGYGGGGNGGESWAQTDQVMCHLEGAAQDFVL